MYSQEHHRLTGPGNELILQNSRRTAESHKRLIIRLHLVPGYNDTKENILKTSVFAQELPGVEELKENILDAYKLMIEEEKETLPHTIRDKVKRILFEV